MSDGHECRVYYEPDDRQAPIVHDAPEGWGGRDWHAEAIADAGTSHTLVGRRYVIACEWCRCVFIAETKGAALDRFRGHEREMATGPEGGDE